MSSLVFGAVFYYQADLRERPEVCVEALRLLEQGTGGRDIRFRGMFTGTDRYSRSRIVTLKSLSQLVVDVRGGVYSDLDASRGLRDRPEATLSLQVLPAVTKGAYPSDVVYTCTCGTSEDIAAAEMATIRLWEIFGPAYGVSFIGMSWNEVFAEVTATPLIPWGVQSVSEEEERLLGIQRLRPSLGTYARGSAWGNYLGSDLVRTLGGFEHLQRAAPVDRVMALPNGGAYLRLTRTPAVLKSEEYQKAADRLAEFLVPVLPGAEPS
jgi:hypothetical protein